MHDTLDVRRHLCNRGHKPTHFTLMLFLNLSWVFVLFFKQLANNFKKRAVDFQQMLWELFSYGTAGTREAILSIT